MAMFVGPRTGTKTRRKAIRQRIRNRLGTSSDDAPTLAGTVAAVRDLDTLLGLTTGGYLGVRLVRNDGEYLTPEKLREALEAWEEAW